VVVPQEARKPQLISPTPLHPLLDETDNEGKMVRVFGIFGPTASGKSDVAAALAARVGGEVVSTDALQAYRGLPILTNRSRHPERLVGIWSLDREGSVGAFSGLAHVAIDTILAAGRRAVVAGGTGLYLRAALAEMDVPPAVEREARERWSKLYDRDPQAAHELLVELDSAAADIHPNDRRRVVRALELAEVGSTLRPEEARLWSEEMRHPTLLLGLDVPKAELDRRIEERTRLMFERGVEDEVRRALAGPISQTARKALGLEEIASLSREEALATIAARTRRYAAYQRKWMRRIPGVVRIDGDRPPDEIAAAIVALGRERERLRRP
jgi:tRNA dimethylallyltransferase